MPQGRGDVGAAYVGLCCYSCLPREASCTHSQMCITLFSHHRSMTYSCHGKNEPVGPCSSATPILST